MSLGLVQTSARKIGRNLVLTVILPHKAVAAESLKMMGHVSNKFHLRMCSKKKDFAERCQVSWPCKKTVSFATRSHGSRLLPGVKDAVYGDLVGHSDFEVNLRPPKKALMTLKSL